MRNQSIGRWTGLVLFACGWLAGAGAASAQDVPGFINYQGILADGQSVALAGKNLTVNFRIYDAQRGGTVIWGSQQMVTTDSNGVFNVSLGDEGDGVPGVTNLVNTIQGVFAGTNAANRWLEVEALYNNSSVMSPRQPFVTVPYAFQAGNALGCIQNFNVGEMLTVVSNAVFTRQVSTTSSNQDSLVFNNSVANAGPLTVDQKMEVAGALTVNGTLAVQGNAVFSNDVAFTEAVEFDGPVLFNNGVSFRGNTDTFGNYTLLASHTGAHTDTGTIQTNGFLIVKVTTTDNDNSNNNITFTLGGMTQLLYEVNWDTAGSDYIHFQGMTLFPVKAGTTWSIYAAGGDIGYNLYYWPIP